MPDRREVLRLEGLRKSYNIGQPNEVEVLHGLDLRLDSADFAALVGPSGSGKSTLLNQIGLLDSPTAGELYLLGQPTRTMDDEARTAARGKHIGFVFQFHHLIGAFTALENVLMPLMVARGKPDREALERARGLLADVGLETLADRKPDQLSGGQRQRIALARALLADPPILILDEATSALDPESEAVVNRNLAAIAQGRTVIVVSHRMTSLAKADAILVLDRGRIEDFAPHAVLLARSTTYRHLWLQQAGQTE